MYLKANESEFIEPVGVHFHIGSQLSELAPIAEAAGIVSEFMASLKAAKIDIKFFDVGGGIGIVYYDEKTISLYEYAQAILAALKSQDVTIVCEPGRFIVGEAGYFLTKVLYEKQNDKKRFVIVDGAMNDLIRPSLYNAYHEVVAVSDGLSVSELKAKCQNAKSRQETSGQSKETSQNQDEKTSGLNLIPADVVGPVCESGDF